LKNYLLFAGSFSVAFVVLQLLSGMLLTMFYTPSIPWEKVSTLSSQVEFGSTSFISPLVISLLALGIAFGTTKLINKKAVQ
jgi:quinol-cytochrome oxidoreductase complex cytochrome b subunit